MEFDGTIRWRIGVIAASVVIAVVACMAAFWILFRLLSIFPRYESLRLLSAFIMGIAVCGVHYTGMMAANYVASESGTKELRLGTDAMTAKDSLYGPLIAAVVVLWLINLYVLVDMRSFIAMAGMDRGGKSTSLAPSQVDSKSETGNVSPKMSNRTPSSDATSPRKLLANFLKKNEVRPEEPTLENAAPPV
jgi:hypothetical protein